VEQQFPQVKYQPKNLSIEYHHQTSRIFFTIGKSASGNKEVTGNGIASKIQ
jgi:hypothetical protein